MSRFTLFFLGVLICVGAFGGLYYRVSNDPGVERRANWALEQIGVRRGTDGLSQDDEASPRSGSTSRRSLSERREVRRHGRQQGEQLKLFKLGLDLANIVIGLIGIYLAASSMRSRRDT